MGKIKRWDLERVRCHCGKFMRHDSASDLYICDPCAEEELRSVEREIKNEHRIEAMRGL